MARGFIFIELLCVMAIVGILSAIAIPAYNDYQYRLNVAEGLLIVQPLQRYIEEYYAHNGRFPSLIDAEEDALSNGYKTKRVIGVDIDQGAIHVRYHGSTIGRVATAFLSLRPVIDEASVSRPLRWLCGNRSKVSPGFSVVGENLTDLDEKYLVPECRQ